MMYGRGGKRRRCVSREAGGKRENGRVVYVWTHDVFFVPPTYDGA